MNIEDFRDYCLQKFDVEESSPFGPDVLVFKVGGKMFALCDIEEFKRINLKCSPENAIELRERYVEVSPGYHMSKEHWNSINPKGELQDSLIKSWVDISYDLIVQSLPKAKQEFIKKGNLNLK